MTIGALVTHDLLPSQVLAPSPANFMVMLCDPEIHTQEVAYGWLYAQMRRAVGRANPAVDLDELTCEFVKYVLEDPEVAAYIAIKNTSYLITAMRRHLGKMRRTRDAEAAWIAHLRRKVLAQLHQHPEVVKVAGNRWALRQRAAPVERLAPLRSNLRGGTASRMPPVADSQELRCYIPEVLAYLAGQGAASATAYEIAKLCWDNLLPRPHFLEILGEEGASEEPSAWTRHEIEAQAREVLARLDRLQAQVALARLRAESQRRAATTLGVTVYAVESRWEALRHAQEAAGIPQGQWDDEPAAWRYYGELIMAGLERLSEEET